MTDVFLFPGQGSQAVGMGQWLPEFHATAKRTFEEADEALGEKLSELIWQGPAEKLKETANAQPAILTVSVALGRILFGKSIRPSVMAGHSLGEFSALVMAEALRFEDAVRLVRKRGQFMQEVVPLGRGAMTAVLGLSDDLVEIVCREVSEKGDEFLVEPANYNCPGQLVISGYKEGVNKATEELKSQGAKRCVPLEVSAPFHSSLLKPAAEKLKGELEKVEINDPKIPYIANVDCAIIKSKDQILSRLVDQVWNPVRWTQSLQKIVSDLTPTRAIEVGPGKVVSGHMKKIDRSIPTAQTDSESNLSQL